MVVVGEVGVVVVVVVVIEGSMCTEYTVYGDGGRGAHQTILSELSPS